MPYKDKPVEKLYWTIGEVAEDLGVNTSSIRYWEKEFGSLRPKRTEKGDRLFTRKDIEQIKQIMHLVKDQGFTLNGAKDRMKQDDDLASTSDTIREQLRGIRAKLVGLSKDLS